MPRQGDVFTPRQRLPDPPSVLVTFDLVEGGAAMLASPVFGSSAARPKYRILRTLEVDEYDEPVAPAEIVALTTPRPPPQDNAFRGTSRRAAKLSLPDAEMEEFDDLKDLIETLPDHATMANHPEISNDRNNNRVEEERRNVRVRTFLYAASLEDDRDYHLIVGRDPSEAEMYMTVEVSGLPPSNSPHFQALDEARGVYFAFFGDVLPNTSYDFYDPPIPVEVEGSLFFDFSHAQGSRPGLSKLRPNMPVVWEIHPVSRIKFEP